MKDISNVCVVSFLSVALVFSANRTGKDIDLIDALIDYTQSLTVIRD